MKRTSIILLELSFKENPEGQEEVQNFSSINDWVKLQYKKIRLDSFGQSYHFTVDPRIGLEIK